MRDNRIGVLAIQEAHLDDAFVDRLHALFGKRLHVVFSSNPERQTQAQGVAIVLNKEITNVKDVKVTVLAHGRAMLVTIPWHNSKVINVLNVYAPNAAHENAAFWRTLNEKWVRRRLPIPDIMLGDFNLVEDSLDRLPCRDDSPNAVESLRSFRANLELIDGWRDTFPDERAYTHTQKPANTKARLDRIYVSNEIFHTAVDWNILIAPFETADHSVVSVTMTDPQLPHMGKGRWSVPGAVLKDEQALAAVCVLGEAFEKALDDLHERTPERNPQSLYAQFKEDTINVLRQAAKRKLPKLDREIESLEADLQRTLNDPEPIATEERLLQAAILEERIKKLHALRHDRIRLAVATRNRVEGETVSKYWTAINKDQKPRDVIYALFQLGSDPAHPELVTRSDEMAELAKTHHDQLQQAGPHHPEDVRQRAIDDALDTVDTFASNADKARLAQRLSQNEVREALKESATGKAAGLDGITYELWKTLASVKTTRKIVIRTPGKAPRASSFDYIKVITSVFNDIEKYGVLPGSSFADGWICPLYKKKDKRDIANYRPITLLNTDYKLFTKALTMKLCKVAPSIIHPDQAGFVPGRNITDQTRLAHDMLAYAECEELNGMIVALDQEKAYDKISHDYLWKTLERFNLPMNFINAVRSLYENAYSVACINGVMSERFKVTRGVRQGDPLSCLLFDLAIEPLACMLRKSTLQGFRIPHVRERLITRLFADDTTVYLSENDNYETLTEILSTWCIAARAKFNIAKTQVIPIGSPEYRTRLHASNQINPTSRIPEDVDIVDWREGVATRILGAFIGYNISEQANPWTPVLDDITANLRRWERGHPTIFGRKLIVEFVVGSKIQYLTKVQGMPKDVEKYLTKQIQQFVWKGRKSQVNMETLYAPRSQGGIQLLDLHTRVEAINITWLPPFADLSSRRPLWCFIQDALIHSHITRASGRVEDLSKFHVFLQTWSPTQRNLPEFTRRLLGTAKKHNVSFAALRLTPKMKRDLPIWYHIGAGDVLNRVNNTPKSRCLRDAHRVRTVGDLLDVIEYRDGHPDPSRACARRSNCACSVCRIVRQQTGCSNPHKCYEHAKKILDSLPPKWHPSREPNADGLTLTRRRRDDNEVARQVNGKILFNPSIATGDDLASGFRIFTDPEAPRIVPGTRRHNTLNILHESREIAVKSACDRTLDVNTKTGVGLFYGADDPKNMSCRLPGTLQTVQAGDTYAAARAAELENGLFAPLTIKSDSTLLINGLTRWLPMWEARGWIGLKNKETFRLAAASLRKRGAPTYLQWTTASTDPTTILGAAALAKDAISIPEADGEQPLPDDALGPLPLPEPDPHFLLSGAQLSALTQKLAYCGIQEQNLPPIRRETAKRLDLTRNAVAKVIGVRPVDATLWKALRHPDISRNIREFLWMVMHNAYRLGNWWLQIPDCEDRALCKHCHVPETMDHILLECTIPGRDLIWSLTKRIWQKKKADWPDDFNVGHILGAALCRLPDRAGKKRPGSARLFRILVTESAHLIWKIRCERVIQREGDPSKWHTANEVENRWYAAINGRLRFDQAMTNPIYGRKALKKTVVIRTWQLTLQDERYLPDNWIGKPGVLVGRLTPEQRDNG